MPDTNIKRKLPILVLVMLDMQTAPFEGAGVATLDKKAADSASKV